LRMLAVVPVISHYHSFGWHDVRRCETMTCGGDCLFGLPTLVSSALQTNSDGTFWK
jgi:hypothetical protein